MDPAFLDATEQAALVRSRKLSPLELVNAAIAEGLPIGTHFVGRVGDEATLFRLAGQLEAARPRAGRRPPLLAE